MCVGNATQNEQTTGERDGALSVYVSPKVVPKSHLLGSASGAGNAIAVESANLGVSSYTGPGAGRYPTASSVTSDVLRIVKGLCPPDPFPLTSYIDIDHDYSSAFYVRVSFSDGLGIIARVGSIAERHGVSVNSVLQNPIRDRHAAEFVVTTEECRLSQVSAMCEEIAKEDFSRGPPLCMPMLIDRG